MSYEPIPLEFDLLPELEMHARAASFLSALKKRRSTRFYSNKPVSRDLIEAAVRSAATAPSGANKQPWRFVAVSSAALKHRIRVEAEKEERESYESRMSDEWISALEALGTDWHKEFLERVPWIVVCFAEVYELDGDLKIKNYYVQESCGIACGLFIAAVHNMGLATLTHTPSPMGFLGEILGRPKNERPFMLFPVGYPADDATVPSITKKPIQEVLIWK